MRQLAVQGFKQAEKASASRPLRLDQVHAEAAASAMQRAAAQALTIEAFVAQYVALS
mgnify:CR=1 FL=1